RGVELRASALEPHRLRVHPRRDPIGESDEQRAEDPLFFLVERRARRVREAPHRSQPTCRAIDGADADGVELVATQRRAAETLGLGRLEELEAREDVRWTGRDVACALTPEEAGAADLALAEERGDERASRPD